MSLGLEIDTDIPIPTVRERLRDDDHRELYDLVHSMEVGNSILLPSVLLPRFRTEIEQFFERAFGVDSYVFVVVRQGIRFWRTR